MASAVTVTVDDDHLGGIEGIADQLRAAGMRVHQVLGSAGVITGEVSDAARSVIAGVPGVAGVSDQQTFQLPPPDAEIQ